MTTNMYKKYPQTEQKGDVAYYKIRHFLMYPIKESPELRKILQNCRRTDYQRSNRLGKQII